MSTWHVRHEGSPAASELPSAQRVLEALRDGDLDQTDEVRGPTDRNWVSIEEHPQFAEAVAEMEPPPPPHPDETRLDMNPLIDVALVLLIFFILTATYTTLRRAIELPPEPAADQSGKPQQVVKFEDVKDRVFKVKVRMEEGKPVIKIEDRVVLLDEIDTAMQEYVRSTGRKELWADVAPDVPWGIEARVYDAAKGADVHQIYWPKGR
jgi:biopolymer transport protein ExbD